MFLLIKSATFYQHACNNGFVFLFRSMRIAEYGEYISVTDCIQRTSFHQNSSCSCRLNKINQSINQSIHWFNQSQNYHHSRRRSSNALPRRNARCVSDMPWLKTTMDNALFLRPSLCMYYGCRLCILILKFDAAHRMTSCVLMGWNVHKNNMQDIFEWKWIMSCSK